MGWLEDAVNVLQLIALPIVIVVTAYGAFSAYLSDFWRGFMLGALVVFLPMLVLNIYLARRSRQPTTAAQEEKRDSASLPSPPPPQSPQVPQVSQQVSIVLGGDELRSILRDIVSDRNKVEELQMKSIQEQHAEAQNLLNLSSSIYTLRNRYDPAWDSKIRGEVIVIHDQLQCSGSAIMQRDFPRAEQCFDAGYQAANDLRSYLETKSNQDIRRPNATTR